MCTSGPCKLLLNVFKCSRSSCGRLLAVRGRECYITFETIATGMTHNVLRQNGEGVVLGNGTLTARLQEPLKRHVTYRNSGLTASGIIQ